MYKGGLTPVMSGANKNLTPQLDLAVCPKIGGLAPPSGLLRDADGRNLVVQNCSRAPFCATTLVENFATAL